MDDTRDRRDDQNELSPDEAEKLFDRLDVWYADHR